MLREQTDCGHPRSGKTSGLVAHADGEPAGWCAVVPRPAYPYLRSVPWRQRSEDRTDAGIWSVPWFVTRGELHVGQGSIFAAAGFAEVSRPTLRRVVMRIDL